MDVILAELLEKGMAWVGVTGGQVGLAALLLAILLEGRKAKSIGTVTASAAGSLWTTLLVLALLAAFGGVTIHKAVIVGWVERAVDFAMNVGPTLLP